MTCRCSVTTSSHGLTSYGHLDDRSKVSSNFVFLRPDGPEQGPVGGGPPEEGGDGQVHDEEQGEEPDGKGVRRQGARDEEGEREEGRMGGEGGPAQGDGEGEGEAGEEEEGQGRWGRLGSWRVDWPLAVDLGGLPFPGPAGGHFPSRFRTSSPSWMIHSSSSPFPMRRAWASARGMDTVSTPVGCVAREAVGRNPEV